MNQEAKKTLASIGIVILILLLAALAKPLFASVRCETQYGGEVCYEHEFTLNKEVWDPGNGKFVDNLVGESDEIYKFSPDEEVTFRISVKNTGEETLNQIDVGDHLPAYLTHVSGDLSYKIYDLAVDDTAEREVIARVIPSEDLPDAEIICNEHTVNEAEAWYSNDQRIDKAQICIKKKVLGVTIVEELPPTGPQNNLILLGISLLSGLAGLVFKKINWL